MYERYWGLGWWNIIRMAEANGISRDYLDPEEYDKTLHPGENIALAAERLGVRTTREWAAYIARWSAE